jgi:membrane associated rhomboid family serine protease
MSDYIAAMFRRRPNDGWFRAGRYDVTTTDLVCALAVASMFVYGFSLESWTKLVFSSELVRQAELWRILTWPIATQPAIFPLLGIVFFWVFGQQLEALFGRGRFLAWMLAVTIVPAVITTVLGGLDTSLDMASTDFGLSTLFLGGIWVYAATYPGVRWFEVIPLWAIAGVFTVLNLLQYSGVGATGQVVFLLLGVGVSLVAGRSLGLATGWPIPHLPLDGQRRPKRSKPPKQPRAAKGKRRGTSPSSAGSGTVIDGPWSSGPPPAPPVVRPGPSPSDQVELDDLLDKIGANGMDGLTAAEKQRLNELSKRLRQR